MSPEVGAVGGQAQQAKQSNPGMVRRDQLAELVTLRVSPATRGFTASIKGNKEWGSPSFSAPPGPTLTITGLTVPRRLLRVWWVRQ